MSATDIASALRGRRSGDGWLCRCPVPSHGQGHGDRNPSLLVTDGDKAPLFTCFGGCDRADIVDQLRARGLLNSHAESYRDRPKTLSHLPEPIEHKPDPNALAIWRAAKPIEGTLAEIYLDRHRALPPPYPPSLRFAPALKYPPSGLSLPAMIAAVSAPDRSVIAVQATFLNSVTGRKAPVSAPRMTFGALGAGAVRLGAATDVLGLAEGVEDAFGRSVAHVRALLGHDRGSSDAPGLDSADSPNASHLRRWR